MNKTTRFAKRLGILSAAITGLIPLTSRATNLYWNATGDWDNPAAWALDASGTPASVTPGSGDIAYFSTNSVTGPETINLNVPQSVLGLDLISSSGGTPVTINNGSGSGNTLTIGAGGINFPSTSTVNPLTINVPVIADGSQAWTTFGGVNFVVNGNVTNGAASSTITIGNPGTTLGTAPNFHGVFSDSSPTSILSMVFSNSAFGNQIIGVNGPGYTQTGTTMSALSTYSGTTTITAGGVELNSSNGAVPNSAVTAQFGTTLGFDYINGPGPLSPPASVTRAKSLTLSGATLYVAPLVTVAAPPSASITGPTNDVITNALTIGVGPSTVSVFTNNSGQNSTLTAASYVHNSGGAVLFVGQTLGQHAAGSATPNSSNIIFNTAPTLMGGGGGTGSAAISILPYALGVNSSNATDTPTDLVTYDTYGIRTLTPSEYTTGSFGSWISSSNVQTGSAQNLGSSSVTINSLMLNTGSSITGTGHTLTVGSGTIFATASTSISGGTLNFGSTEAFIAATGGTTNVTIGDKITTSGGLTVGAPGGASAPVILTNTANAITGGITLNSVNFVVPNSAAVNGVNNASPNNVTMFNAGLVFSSGGDTFGTGSNTITLNGINNYFSTPSSPETIASVIQGSGGFSLSTSHVTLSAPNTYSGATILGSSNLTVSNANGLQNSSALTVGANSTFNFITGTGGTLTLAPTSGTAMTLADGSTVGVEVGGTIAVRSGATVSATGTVHLNLYAAPNLSPSGTFTLISSPSGGLSGATYALGPSIYNDTNFSVSGFTATDTAITINAAALAPLTIAYWKGGLSGAASIWAVSNGSTASNFTTDAAGTVATPLVPGSTADVVFSAAGAGNEGGMTLGASMSIRSLTIADNNGFVLNADGNTLTVGAGNITINSTNNQIFAAPIAGVAGLTKSGSGTVSFTGASTFSGNTVVTAAPVLGSANALGTLALSTPAGSIANSAVTANGNVIVNIDSNVVTPTGSVTRMKSLTLNGAFLNDVGTTAANTSDLITNALTIGSGGAVVLVNAAANKNDALTAGSYSRTAGGTVEFVGTALGTQTPGPGVSTTSSNVMFTSSPTLVGGGGSAGTSTISILPYAISMPGAGIPVSPTTAGLNFVTYDATKGVRPLVPGEYTGSLAGLTSSAQMNQNNANITTSQVLTANTYVNSMLMSGGATITGAFTLNVTGGTVFSTGTSNSITGGTLNFGSTEAYLGALLNGGTTLSIGDQVIANNGLIISDYTTGVSRVALTNTTNVITSGITVNGSSLLFPASISAFNGVGNSAHNNVVLNNGGGINDATGGETFGSPSDTITLNGIGGAIGANSGSITIASVIQGSGTFGNIPGGGSSTIFTANNTFTGGFSQWNKSVLTVSSDPNLGAIPASPVTWIAFGGSSTAGFNATASFVMNSNRSIVIGGTDSGSTPIPINSSPSVSLAIGGVISGSGAKGISAGGGGRLILSGSNTYTGGTVVAANTTLQAASTTALGTGAVSVSATSGTLNFVTGSGGTLTLGPTSGTALTLPGGSSVGAEIGAPGTGGKIALQNTATATTSGAVKLNVFGISGTSPSGNYNLITTNAVAGGLAGASYSIGNVYNATNFSVTVNTPVAANAVSVTAAQVPLINVPTAEFWKGTPLTSAAGVWAASNGGGTTGSSNFTLDSGGLTATGLVPGQGADVTFSASSPSAEASMFLGASMSIQSLTISDSNTFLLNNDLNTLTVSNVNSMVPGIVVTSPASVTINAPIAGTANIKQLGLGIFTLGGSNSFSGTVTVGDGVTAKGTLDALLTSSLPNYATASNVTVNTGATLAVGVGAAIQGNWTSANVDTLRTAANFAANSFLGLDTFTATGGTFTYASNITDTANGALGLTKLGAGTLFLTGVNSYTGGTNINGGTLNFQSGGLGTTGTIAFGGGTLQYSSSPANSDDVSGRVANSTGAVSIDTNGNNVAFAGPIDSTNTGGLTKLGAGNLVLSAANSYTGGTTVGGGTLQLNGSGTLGNTSNPLTVNTGGTLDLNGTAQAVGNLAGTGGSIFNNATATAVTLTIGTGNGTGGTYSGVIADHTSGTGTVALTKVGSGTITLGNTETYTGNTTVSAGSLVLSSAALLSATNNVSNSGSISFNRNQTIATYNGNGTLHISPGTTSLTVTGGGTIGGSVVDGGTLVANGATPLIINPTGQVNVPLTVNGNVTVATHSPTSGFLQQTILNIGVGPSGVLTVADPGSGQANHNDRTLLITNSLNVTAGGTVDLNGNDLVVHGSNVAALTPLLKSGFNAGVGHWNGTGIRSTTAGNDTSFLTTLGVAQGVNGQTFDGFGSVVATDVLVKYTYYGDADLSGTVDGTDYSVIDSNNGMTGATWSQGDFNYDGNVDGSDYSLIDNAFNQQGTGWLAGPAAMIATNTSEIAGGGSASVPEPASLGLIGIGLMSLATRRRRRSVQNHRPDSLKRVGQ